jgi:hypothetical protein
MQRNGITYSFAKTPLKAAHAPLATAKNIHCVRWLQASGPPPTRRPFSSGMAALSLGVVLTEDDGGDEGRGLRSAAEVPGFLRSRTMAAVDCLGDLLLMGGIGRDYRSILRSPWGRCAKRCESQGRRPTSTRLWVEGSLKRLSHPLEAMQSPHVEAKYTTMRYTSISNSRRLSNMFHYLNLLKLG